MRRFRGELPEHAFVPFLGKPYAASAGMDPGNVVQASSSYFGANKDSNAGTSLAGNFAEYRLWLAPGTYTFTLYHRKALNRGIYTLSIDGVNHGTTIDGYDSGGGLAAKDALTGVSVPGGLMAVRWTVSGKNASSSSFIMSVSAFEAVRTGG